MLLSDSLEEKWNIPVNPDSPSFTIYFHQAAQQNISNVFISKVQTYVDLQIREREGEEGT